MGEAPAQRVDVPTHVLHTQAACPEPTLPYCGTTPGAQQPINPHMPHAPNTLVLLSSCERKAINAPGGCDLITTMRAYTHTLARIPAPDLIWAAVLAPGTDMQLVCQAPVHCQGLGPWGCEDGGVTVGMG